MGNYNSQYESYYSSLANRKKNYGSYNYSYNNRKGFNLDGNFLLKRLIRDLIGVFILFAIIIVCKLLVTPQTTAVYNYSKAMINKNYDYKNLITTVKQLDIKQTEEKVTDWLENVKSKLTGSKSLKDKLKSDFIIPVEGTITSKFGEINDPVTKGKKLHDGIDIGAKIGTDVACPYEGKIKEIGEDVELGKYILIDHGGGIETKYGHLNDVLVKKDDAIKKGQVIAKTGSTGKPSAPQLHFEVLYMGEAKNPEDYLNFNKN